MGTCSYTWIDEENDEQIEKECLEETWEGSDRFCIFHDPSPEKDADLFKEKVEEQMKSETERHDFVGYCFPKNFNFSGKEFKVDSDFSRAIFQSVYFKETTFQEEADFSQAEFQFALFRKVNFYKNADFSGATFYKKAIFSGATFHKNANFRKAIFQSAEFNRTIFQTTADFRKAIFQDADFRGASFLGYADFWGATFQEDAFFSDSTFQNANFGFTTFRSAAFFRPVTFQECANFNGATFQYTDFYEATFQARANFGCTTFRSAAYFREVTFHENADFSQATFHKKVELMPRSVEKIDLRYTEFLSRSYVTADLTKTLFHRAFIENVAFTEWPEKQKIYEETYMRDEGLSFKELETIYRDLKQNMQDHGDYSKAGEFYYREMEMRRKGAEKIKDRIGLKVYKCLAGYGENYWNTAAVSGSIILIFALLYGTCDCLQYSIGNPCLYQEIIDVVYFSFVTFTTLGLGDITPLTTIGKVLICLEAVIGAFMIAVFVVVFVRKMAR